MVYFIFFNVIFVRYGNGTASKGLIIKQFRTKKFTELGDGIKRKKTRNFWSWNSYGGGFGSFGFPSVGQFFTTGILIRRIPRFVFRYRSLDMWLVENLCQKRRSLQRRPGWRLWWGRIRSTELRNHRVYRE